MLKDFFQEIGIQAQFQDADDDGTDDRYDLDPKDINQSGSRNIPINLEYADHSDILRNAYKTFVQDGKLTRKEINTLEKIGAVLDGADIKINRQTGDAKITNTAGETSHLRFPKKEELPFK